MMGDGLWAMGKQTRLFQKDHEPNQTKPTKHFYV